MEAPTTADMFLFEGFRLDRSGLSRRDQSGVFLPVAIGSRALEILAVLVARPGKLVTRDEIMNVVWSGVVVESSNLPVQIAALRRVLDDGRPERSYIQTVPGRGYRFVAPVTRGVATGFAAPADVRDNARPRLSIVVLPFANLSNDPGQQYFADAVTEEVTTDLSRIEGMFVISRNTAFTYRDKAVDTRQIGRELSVRYLLEGSVQRSGNRVRVGAQLIDAETDAHLWAERFDREAAALFVLQDEVTSRIANTLGVELIGKEAAREPHVPDALDFILRGRAMLFRPRDRETYDAAIGLFRRAWALDPGSVEARSRLAMALAGRQADFGSAAADSDIQEAEGLSLQALSAAPRNAVAYCTRGEVLRVQGRLDEAISAYEEALAVNPNMVRALADLGRCKIFIGPIDEAITAQRQAIRLSPRDPQIGFWYFRIGQAHLLQQHLDEAIPWLEKARSVEPGIPFVRAYLAAAYALRGNPEGAAAELIAAQRLDLQDNYSSIARLKFRNYQLTQNRGARPEIRELLETTYYTGLRKAGMPEA